MVIIIGVLNDYNLISQYKLRSGDETEAQEMIDKANAEFNQ